MLAAIPKQPFLAHPQLCGITRTFLRQFASHTGVHIALSAESYSRA